MRCGICDEPITGEDLDFAVFVDDERVHLECLRGERSSGPDSLITGPAKVSRAERESLTRSRPLTMREQLDAEMKEVLLQLLMCSHIPAGPYDPIGRSRDSKETSGARPPGDLGAEPCLAQKYDACETDDARRAVIQEARDELKTIRHGPDERPAEVEMDRDDWLKTRNKAIVKDGVGLSTGEAAIKFRCGERDVIRARREASREIEFGKDPEFGGGRNAPRSGPEANARRERALELDANGMGISQIALALGVDRKTIRRYLDEGRRAA